MLLTKQRKRVSPKVMKKLVYIRYKKKCSEEELKNRIEEDRADGYKAEVQDKDLADY